MKRWGINLVTILLFLCVVSSCDRGKDYRAVIPADAGIVMKIDVPSLLDKSELNSKENLTVLKDCLTEQCNTEMATFMKNLLEKPTEMGLDWSRPLYLYIKNVGDAALIAKVQDKAKLKSTFETLINQQSDSSLNLSERDGVTYLAFGDMAVIAFDDVTLQCYVQAKENGSVVEKVLALYKQKEEDSFLSKRKELFQAFATRENDIDGVVACDVFGPAQYQSMMEAVLPEGVKMSDLNAIFNVEFDDGKVVFKGTSLYLSDAAKAWYQNKELRSINNRVNQPTEETLLWFGMGLDGDKASDKMQKTIARNPMLQELSGMIMPIIQNVNGTLSFSLAYKEKSKGSAAFACEPKKGEAENFLNNTNELLENFNIMPKSVGVNQYELVDDKNIYRMGLTEEGTFFVKMNEDPSQRNNGSLPDWFKEVSDNSVFFYFDMNKFAELMPESNKDAFALLSMCDNIICSSKNGSEVKVELNLKQGRENALKQVVELIKLLKK